MYDEFEREMMMDEEEELDNSPTGENEEELEDEEEDAGSDAGEETR